MYNYNAGRVVFLRHHFILDERASFPSPQMGNPLPLFLAKFLEEPTGLETEKGNERRRGRVFAWVLPPVNPCPSEVAGVVD